MAGRLKSRVHTLMGRLVRSRAAFQLEMRRWDQAAPIGQEFGSPDYDRLMEVDLDNKTGVYSPQFIQQIQESLAQANAGKTIPYQTTQRGTTRAKKTPSARTPRTRK